MDFTSVLCNSVWIWARIKTLGIKKNIFGFVLFVLDRNTCYHITVYKVTTAIQSAILEHSYGIVVIIVVVNGLSDPSSNPGQICLHFTLF